MQRTRRVVAEALTLHDFVHERMTSLFTCPMFLDIFWRPHQPNPNKHKQYENEGQKSHYALHDFTTLFVKIFVICSSNSDIRPSKRAWS